MAASQVTELLEAWRKGDRSAPAKLLPLVYEQLHRIAKRHLAHERADHTLQPTALVNEAYIRVAKAKDFHFADRVHFLGRLVIGSLGGTPGQSPQDCLQ
jgi:hypothetical protein